MCRCCQRTWEDFYWNCIEEKFCYDESIANYNPEDDEYFTNKTGNGFLTSTKLENNNSPVCHQPSRLIDRNNSHHISAKIHEDDYRQIQTNGPFLGPEILAVFANSQIFHDHQPPPSSTTTTATTTKSPPGYPSVHGRTRELNSEKLLIRLEGVSESTEGIKQSTERITESIKSSTNSTTTVDANDEVVLRPHFDHLTNTAVRTPIMNKRLRNVQNLPYFSFRPASENDIFAISGTTNSQISMTPEIPSISYSTLPKNYDDTPSLDKYKETISLQSIQTANSARMAEFDYTMPRYYRKSDIILQSTDSLTPKSPRMSPKKIEISKRLKLIRNTLPPLAIHLNKDHPKDKTIN